MINGIEMFDTMMFNEKMNPSAELYLLFLYLVTESNADCRYTVCCLLCVMCEL
jgi:hypothetical protein